MKYLLIVVLALSGCKSIESPQPETIIPVRAVSKVASFDGNEQNSGIVGYVEGKGFEITKSAASRYTKLSDKFKEEPVVLLHEDGKIFLNKEGMVHFLKLNDWELNK